MWFCPVDSLSCEEVDDGAVLLPVRRGPPVGKVRELSPREYLCGSGLVTECKHCGYSRVIDVMSTERLTTEILSCRLIKCTPVLTGHDCYLTGKVCGDVDKRKSFNSRYRWTFLQIVIQFINIYIHLFTHTQKQSQAREHVTPPQDFPLTFNFGQHHYFLWT